MSTVTTARAANYLAGGVSSVLGLAFGLTLPIAAFSGLVTALVAGRTLTTVLESDGTTLAFTDNHVTITLPDGTAAIYTLQELADAAAGAGALPQGGVAATSGGGISSSADNAALLADAVRLGATLLG